MMGDNLDNRSLPGIKLDVVMGRNAGWLTAASVLARQHEDDGPHLVYVPERVFDVQLSGSGALGDLLAAEIKKRLGEKLRVRADTFGYLQRSFAGLASDVDAKEARQVGRVAAEEALKGKVRHGSI